MILTAHQPVYLPWLGLFHKIALAEQFCIFDIVQYQTKDFNNRNKIKTHTGPIWLSVPVESSNHLEKLICDIKIIDNGWNKKHVKSIKHTYMKAPYFKDYVEVLEQQLLGRQHVFLTELNSEMLATFLKLLGIDVPVVKASDYDFAGKKSDLVLDMCVSLDASDYIFGEQGRNYADAESFRAHGVNAFFQKYNHPEYDQLNGPFMPYMSIVDLLFNCGPASRDIIMSGNAASLRELER
jgi:hypothetical protein